MAGGRSSRHDGVHAAPRHAAHAAARTGPGNAARHVCSHGLPHGRCRPGGRAERTGARLRVALRARPRLPQDPAPAPRAPGRGALPPRSARRAIACSRTPRPCSRRRSPAMPASAGSASTPTCSTGTTARGFSSARCTPTCRCRSMRPSTSHCGSCTRVHRHLPDAGHRRARTDSMPGAAFPTSRSSSTARFPCEFRPRIGNRVYGCDDCQLVCPWNRYRAAHGRARTFARATASTARRSSTCSPGPRREFLRRTAGQRDSAHRPRALAAQRRRRARQRAGPRARSLAAMRARASHPCELVREHVEWALEAQRQRARGAGTAGNPRTA